MHEIGQIASPNGSIGDEMLCLAVKEAISRSEPIRSSSLHSIVVDVADGKVVLSGLIGSDSLRPLAEWIAAGVPGVRSVENLLVSREDLERTIAAALGAAEETRHLRILVRAAGRVPVLYGVVSSQEEAEAVLHVAKKAIHDLEVRSELHVLPAGEPAIILEQHSLEGREMARANRLQRNVEEPQAAADTNPPSVQTPPSVSAEGLA